MVNADIHFPLFYCDTTCEGTNYKHMFPKRTVKQYLVGIRIEESESQQRAMTIKRNYGCSTATVQD